MALLNLDPGSPAGSRPTADGMTVPLATEQTDDSASDSTRLVSSVPGSLLVTVPGHCPWSSIPHCSPAAGHVASRAGFAAG